MTARVVGDEDIGQVELFLQVAEQIEDLRLDRDVKSGDGIIRQDDLRLECKGSGDSDSRAARR